VAKIKLDRLQEGLSTKRLGHNIFFSSKIDSTNNWAKELAAYGASEGTVVIAETQTAGRGRFGREWVSPSGGLWFSVILKPKLRPTEVVKLTLVSGLAVAKVLHEIYGLKTETKWPNDVQLNGKKICGILTETNTTGEVVNFVVIGIGVNTNFDVEKAFPEPLRKVATSLENELGRKVSLEELFRALIKRLENLYDLFLKDGFNPILEEWKKYAGFLNCQVEVANQDKRLSGLALDVDHECALVLRLEDGSVRRVFVGDVSLRAK